MRFQGLDKDRNGFLTQNELLSLPELTMNPLATRITALFVGEDHFIQDRISFPTFLKVLATFSPQAPVEQKRRLAFQLYDANQDGVISKTELMDTIKLMVADHISA